MVVIAIVISFVVAIKQKKVSLVITSIMLFLIAVAIGVAIALKATNMVYVKAKKAKVAATKPRTGIEIYESLLGKNNAECVHIINYHDVTIPVMDYAIFLEGITCADEVKKILTSNPKLVVKKVGKNDTENLKYVSDEPDWFTINLGKNYFEASYIEEEIAKGETFCFSADSTKFFYCQYIN